MHEITANTISCIQQNGNAGYLTAGFTRSTTAAAFTIHCTMVED